MKRELDAIRPLLYKNFSASHEELTAPQRDSVLSNICGDARLGITEPVPERIRPSEAVSHQLPRGRVPQSPPGAPRGGRRRSAAAEHRAGLRRGRRQRPLWLAVAVQLLTNALGTCQPVGDVRDRQ